MNFLSKLKEYGGSWTPADTFALDAKEVAQIASAKITESQFGSSICLMLKSGRIKFIPLNRDSTLVEGDVVKPESIEITRLERAGDEDIFRADAEKA